MDVKEAVEILNLFHNRPLKHRMDKAWQVVKDTIRKYIWHNKDCDAVVYFNECTCGLSDILKLLEQ